MPSQLVRKRGPHGGFVVPESASRAVCRQLTTLFDE
jgi:hypothetical protein